MNRFCNVLSCCALSALAFCISLPMASGADATAKVDLNSIRRIDVPDDRPEAWPFRDEKWLPINREEFESLLKRAAPAPIGPAKDSFREVRYSAVLVGDSLVQGKLQTEWKGRNPRAEFLNLGTPNLAIEELSWNDGRAVWGTSLDGRHSIWMDRREGTLQGTWSRRGRPLLSGLAFDLEFLPADITQVQLEIPRELSVSSDAGDLERADHPHDESRAIWTVHLGNLNRCRLAIAPRAQTATGIPTLLYELETNLIVGSGEPLVYAAIQAEVLGGSVDQFTISLPRTLDVVAATIGEQTPLAWESIAAEGPTGKILVKLPEPSRGKLRPIRLECSLRRTVGESLAVPQIGVEGGTWLDGRLIVTVARPWELRSYRATGFRQSAPPVPRAENETITFQQLSLRSQLLLNIDRPTTERVAHAMNLLISDDEGWTLTTEIAFGSRSGVIYSASCRIPDDWSVTSVVQLGGGREEEQLPGWEVQTHPDSGQLLLMEFSEGLTPGRINALRIIAQRSRLTGDFSPGWPLILPIDCETSEVILHGRESDLKDVLPESSDALENFDRTTAADVWNTLPAWFRVNSGPDYQLLQVTNPDALRSPAADGSRRINRADAEIQIQLAEGGATEQISIQLRGVPARGEIELEMPARLADAVWSIKDYPQFPAQLRRMGSSIAEPPASTGDFQRFRLALPDEAADTITLIGRRTTSRSSELSVPLVFVPSARNFFGRISVQAEHAGIYRVRETFNSEPLTANSGEPIAAEPQRWTYRTAERAWTIVARSSAATVLNEAPCTLRSILSEEPNGFDLHELSVPAPAGTELQSSVLTLPSQAELVAVMQDGQLLSSAAESNRVELTGWNPDSRSTLRVIYRTPAATLFCRTMHRLVVPELPWRCTNFTWRACLPPDTDLRSLPSAFQSARGHSRAAWRENLFGVLQQHNPSFGTTNLLEPLGDPTSPATAADSDVATIRFPPAWQVIDVEGFDLPAESSFIVWNRADLQLLSWTALLTAWPLGWWLRRKASGTRFPWLSGSIAAAGCLAVFGPAGWNSVFGSVCAGLIIGVVLPIERWNPLRKQHMTDHDASVSTQVFRRAVTSMTVCMLIVRGLNVLWAQDAAPTLKGNASQNAARRPSLCILVPVDRRGQPSQKLPLVYMTPELKEAISKAGSEAEREPRQLVAEAQTIITGELQGRLTARARYVIDVISAVPPTQLRIPLEPGWQAGLEGCVVNGLPQAATADDDGRFLNVLIEQLPQGDAPSNSKQLKSWRYEALVEARLNSMTSPGPGEFHTGLFPAINRRLTWQSSAPWQHVDIPEANGHVTISLDRRTLEASLGAASAATVINRPVEQQLRPTGTTELEVLQLLTLRPAVNLAAFRVQCRVLDGTVDRFLATLPPGAVLREIRGHQVLQTLSQPMESGGTRVVLEFSEPLKGEFVIEGEYLLPRTSPEERIEVPRFAVTCGASMAAVRNLAAVATSPEFQVQLINLDDPGTLPLPVDQFVTRWGDSIPTLRPQAAFEVQPNGQPAFRLTTLPAEQQLVSWSEVVTVSRRKVDWLLTAEIAAQRTPLLTHSLLVDRRLNLESVSVLENDAEHMLRWSKTPLIGSSQNRLTLFLNQESAGTSQLRIRGSLQVRPGAPILLPSVRFEASQSIPGTLTLAHEPGHRLTIEGRDSMQEGPAAAGAPDEVSDSAVKRLTIPEGETGLTVRLDPLAGACTQQSYWLVIPGESTAEVRGWMKLSPLEGTREVRLSLPEWLKDVTPATVQRGSPPVEESEGKQRFLQWTCESDPEETLELSWQANVALPVAEILRLPLPSALKSVESSAWAALESDSGWEISHAATMPAAQLPELVRSKLPAALIRPDVEVFRIDDVTLSMLRKDTRAPDVRSSVAMVEQLLRNTGDGGWEGQMDVYPASAGHVVAISVPAETEVLALFADGVAISRDNFDAAERIWQVDHAGRYRRLTLRWRQSATAARAWNIGVSRAVLPICLQERQPETYVRLDSASGWLSLPRDGTPVSSWELAAARVEKDLQRQTQLGQIDDHGARLLWSGYRRAADLAAHTAASSTLSLEERQRWESLTQAMRSVPEPQADPLGSSPSEAGIYEIHRDDRIYRLSDDGAAQFTCWIVREDFGRWIAGGITFLIAGALLWRIVSWLSRPWWQTHRAAAWIVCGAVWWLCFTPQILGLAMIAWAMWEWWRRPVASPSPAV